MRLATVVAVVGGAVLGCQPEGTGPVSPPPPPPAATRAYRMGFSGFPPKPDQQVAVAALELWTRRADIAIVHEQLPWPELLAGTPPDSILAREKDGLIGYYRAKGLQLVFIADANDGLARAREAPDLLAAGRSITEPAIQLLYRRWIRAFVDRYHPEYVGLAAETNLIRLAAPAPLYQAVVTVVNAAAAELKTIAGPPKLFVSVQVETAWGKFSAQPYLGVEADFADFPFIEAVGLSSYPYFVWADPADLPADYYSRLLNGRSLPVLVVEGGWASESAPGAFTSSPERQARYFARQAALLAPTTPVAWIQLAPTDLEVRTFPADLQTAITPFSRLGVLDSALAEKPALRVWDSLFTIPRA
ncbi:MAG: hypothetical protein AB7L66_23130 [Gemmatimonadales bacterium]